MHQAKIERASSLARILAAAMTTFVCSFGVALEAALPPPFLLEGGGEYAGGAYDGGRVHLASAPLVLESCLGALLIEGETCIFVVKYDMKARLQYDR